MNWIKVNAGIKTGVPKSREYVKPCHSPLSDKIYYSITLLYTDNRKYLSDEMESFFDLTHLKGFNILKISGQREHQWLTSNQKEIVIKEFPIFLIAREGYPTIMVSKKKASQVKELILKLSQTE